jgi:hypothetical protein
MLKTLYLKEIKVFSVFHQAILSPRCVKGNRNLVIVPVYAVDREFFSIGAACYGNGILKKINRSGHKKHKGQGKQAGADKVLYAFVGWILMICVLEIILDGLVGRGFFEKMAVL